VRGEELRDQPVVTIGDTEVVVDVGRGDLGMLLLLFEDPAELPDETR